MFGAIAGGIASALAGGAMSKLFGGGQKAASGGIQGDVLATDNNTVGMGDAGIKSAIQGSNVPNRDEAVPSFVSGAMAKAGKGLLEGTLQAGTSAVSDKLLVTNLASHFFDLVIGKILTSRLSLSKHLAHNLGNLLLLGKIGVFHNRRNASSRLLLLISKHLILCIYLVFRILA